MRRVNKERKMLNRKEIYCFLLIIIFSAVEPVPLLKKSPTRPFRIVEGDIAVDAKNANIEVDYATKWKNGRIPYMIDSVYSKKIIKSNELRHLNTKFFFYFKSL